MKPLRALMRIAVILLILVLVQSVQAAETYEFVTKWGSFGEGDGQFGMLMPRWVATDSSGYIYATESHRIQKFESDGTYITQWGSEGTDDGQFSLPEGLAVDSSGYVYVADSGNSRIQKFESDGTYITQWGSRGTGDGQFSQPFGVAVDSSGYVYIVDGNSRIQKFESDGTYIIQWGSEGTGDGQFYLPFGVAVDSSDNVYVADLQRVQKFESDGTFVTPCRMSGAGQFIGVAVDPSGNVYAADTNDHIQKFAKVLTTDSLKVTSDPAGAEIYLDGVATGQVTPYTFTGLASKDYEVVVEKECYTTPDPKTVTVSPASIATADFALVSDRLCSSVPEFPSPVIPAVVLIGCIGIALLSARRNN